MMNSGASRGVVLMLLGILLLTSMDMVVKSLVIEDVSPIQILAIRSLIIVPVMFLLLWARGQRHLLQSSNKRWLFGRAVVGFFAPFCFFLSLKVLPLADATVVFFSGTFMITILSVFTLKENVGWHRWLAVAAGYVGVIVAADPEGSGGWWGYGLALIGSTAYALLFISGKWLSKTESTVSLVFYFNLGVGAVALLALPFFWQPIDVDAWGRILAITVLALAGHYALTAAFAQAEASALAPFEYTALVWAVLFDWSIYQILPELNVWLGAAIIIVSSLYVAHRERLNQQAAAAS